MRAQKKFGIVSNMSEMAIIERGEQATLLDLSAKDINPYWIDPKQPLKVPANPLHWKAHELQILLEILKKQASKNPAQFNSRNYIDTLNAYTEVITQINMGKTADEVLDEGGLDQGGNDQGAPTVGEGASVSVDLGVSAKNPLAG